MKKNLILLVVLADLVGTGCGHSGWDRLSKAEQNLLQRCDQAIYPARCGDDRDPVYGAFCRRQTVDEYVAQPSKADRQEWLVAHGCTPPMVYAGERRQREVAEETDYQPPRRKKVAKAVEVDDEEPAAEVSQ